MTAKASPERGHIVKRAKSLPGSDGGNGTSEHSAGQDVLPHSPSSMEANHPRLADLNLRDRPTTPATELPASVPQNSRKRTAELAEHGDPPTVPSGDGLNENKTNAGSKRTERRGILTPKARQNQSDPEFNRGVHWRPVPPTSLFDPDLEDGTHRVNANTKKFPTYDHNSPITSVSRMGAPPREQQNQPRESTSAATPTQQATNPSPQSRILTETPRRYAIHLQPETRPISEAQLVNEVRGIYAGLVMVERKCVEIDQQQASTKSELSNEQWQALIALHRTLLHEHHDFFLASQHPSASQALQKLASKYAMPARMWRHGIHSFLELLRHRLPEALEHMLTFIYTAYSMMTLLVESVPSFQDTWIECLGDVARYRMAVEESDIRDRETWAGVARYWYNKAADKSPDVGRIQHHLAVLARPNILQQLFYYSKSLVCIQAFPNTHDSILLLFNQLLHPPQGQKSSHPRHLPAMVAFVKAHGILFFYGQQPDSSSLTSFVQTGDEFMSHFGTHIGRMTFKWREQGVYIASTNFAAMLEYGNENGILMSHFRKAYQEPSTDRVQSASEYWATAPSPGTSPLVESSDSHLESLRNSSYFTFHVFSFVLRHIGNKNVVPHVHTSLAFLWSLILIPSAMAYVEAEVPWQHLVTFLNSLNRQVNADDLVLESNRFPMSASTPPAGAGAARTVCHLPEDFLMRGQIWSHLYHPPGFFDNPSVGDDERSLELPSVASLRGERCIWLGHRIASMNRWVRFDKEDKKFLVTDHALELENICNHRKVFARAAKKRFEGSGERGWKFAVDPKPEASTSV